MWRHYVYLHRKADTGEVFYVGKGTLRRSMKKPERAYSTAARNGWWRRVADKHGFAVEMVACFIDDVAAQEFECDLIAQYGRANLGQGTLVNLTDGGDGHSGIIVSEELREKRRQAAARRGPLPPEWVSSLRRSRKDGGNGGVVKAGDRLPPKWRDAISRAKIGALNPMHGRTGEAHPRSRAVKNMETGEIYPTISAAALALGMKMQVLHNQLTGHRQNRTALRLVG